jgi:hypothetical protein
VPEDKRKGVFKLLATESKDSGVPAFVPAEAVQFSRWRADGQKFWASIEAMVNEISPGSMGFVLTQLETAMREKNPDFDFRKSLVANLGDDLMTYQKAPRGKTLEEFNAAPSLFLLGSPNAEQLLQSLRSLLAMIPGPMMGTEAKEREFLGKKIYSLPLPTVGAAKERSLSFTASGGYLVMGNDAAMVEEYLRSGDAKPKALREAPGLTEAMQKIGGAAGGLFGYQNDTETMRALFETLKADPAALDNLLAQTPIKPQIGDQKLVIKEWLDFSLLPAFDQVAKYFYMTVYSGRMTPSGFNLRVFSPTPPQMK